MSYSLALVLVAVAALLAAALCRPRRHPRHAFILEMVARLASADAVGGFATGTSRKERQAA